ncbi:MAG: ISNCY family transposase [Chitinophagaceae bacterium]|nr:ISNCY family transposase [Oligoflexus sp.]
MDGAIVMTKNEQYLVRIIEDYRAGRVSRKEAATLLDISEKSVQRKSKRVKLKGVEGIKHGNCGLRPVNKVGDSVKAAILKLASQVYYDFNMTHCYQILVAKHDLRASYSTFHSWCRSSGIGKRKRRRPAKKRIYRDRLSNEGLMLQMDGSHHKWNGQDEWVLIAAIDDATSDIPFAGFYRSEDTLNCKGVLQRIIEVRGIPESLYVDHAGWFGGMKRQHFSQFTRACEELGIRVIYANSPEAKGRIERTWQTFQDRLIPELRIEGIKAMEAANTYLQKTFIPKYWQIRNTVEARNSESRYRELDRAINLNDVFCMKYPRKVRKDHTVMFDNRLYALKGIWEGSIANKEIVIVEPTAGPLRACYGILQLGLEEVKQPNRRMAQLSYLKRVS